MTNILLIFSMVSCLGFNTPSSDVTPPKKIFFITKVPVKVQLPPCTIKISLSGGGKYKCPGSSVSIPWLASGSCTATSTVGCANATTIATTCAIAALSASGIAAQNAAALKCPQ